MKNFKFLNENHLACKVTPPDFPVARFSEIRPKLRNDLYFFFVEATVWWMHQVGIVVRWDRVSLYCSYAVYNVTLACQLPGGSHRG